MTTRSQTIQNNKPTLLCVGRRMNSKTIIYSFDDIVAEPAALKVSKDGRPVQLEPKAFEVLSFLIENRGRLIEKDELLT